MKINQFQLLVNNSITQKNISSLISLIKKHSHPRIPTLPLHVKPLLSSFSNIKLVVFDIYGTLLHSGAGDINQLSQSQQQSFIVPELQIAMSMEEINILLHEYIRLDHSRAPKHISCPEIDAIEIWQQLSKDDRFPHSILTPKEAAQCAVYYELNNNPSWFMPHAIEVLSQLQKTRYMLGIISNAQFYTPLFLEALGNIHKKWQQLKFPIQVWSYCLREAKPSTSLFKLALSQCAPYNILPNEILYIGNDKRNDILPAQQCGMHTLLFAGDSISYRPRLNDTNLANIYADGIITSLNDILHCLK